MKRLKKLPLALTLAIALVVALAAPPHALADTYYKWTDERGEVHITDDASKVPPRYRGQVGVRRLTPRDSGYSQAPQGSYDAPAPSGPEPTAPSAPDMMGGATGSDSAPGYEDYRGRGPEYWQGRKQELQNKVRELERKVQANDEVISGLSTSRAAKIGGRRERGRLATENADLKSELERNRQMLRQGLADEALREGVPADFATGLRGE
jgi:hypothetical protein